jgi:hypothetical protein
MEEEEREKKVERFQGGGKGEELEKWGEEGKGKTEGKEERTETEEGEEEEEEENWWRRKGKYKKVEQKK